MKKARFFFKEIQIKIWKKLAVKWVDDRSTAEIIEEIYHTRTMGRDIENLFCDGRPTTNPEK